MATGSLTDYPWLFRKFIRPLGLQALQAFWAAFPGRLPLSRLPEGDPASPTPRSRPRRTPTPRSRPRPQPLLHNDDLTGHGHSAAHDPLGPRWAWLQEAVRGGRSPVRPGTVATPATTSSTTHSCTAQGLRAPSARERREGGPAFPSRPRV